MTDVTRILSQIEGGDPKAAQELLPLVYEELRKLAAQKMAQEGRVGCGASSASRSQKCNQLAGRAL